MSSAKKTSGAVIAAILLLLIFVALNAISARRSFRLDLTEDRLYTLPEGLVTIIDQAVATEDIVEIVAYVTDEVPGAALGARDQLRDLINDVGRVGRGKIDVTFVDPTESDSLAEEAAEYGIVPVQMFDPSGAQATITTVYAGVVVKRGGDYETVPQLMQTRGISVSLDPQAEYLIASAIRKMTADERQTVGHLAGHGEPSMGHPEQENSILGNIEQVYGTMECDTTALGQIPESVDLLLVRAPTQLEERDQYALDQFIMAGKPVIFLVPRLFVNQSEQLGFSAFQLDAFLEHYGVKREHGLIVGPARRGNLIIRLPNGQVAQWPILELDRTRLDDEDRITAMLDGVSAFLANPVVPAEDLEGFTFTPLVVPPEEAGTVAGVQDLQQSGIGPTVKEDSQVSPLPEQSALYVRVTGAADSFFKDKDIPEPPTPAPGQPAPPEQPFREHTDRFTIYVAGYDFLSDIRGFTMITNTMDHELLGEELISIRSRQTTTRPIELMTKAREEELRQEVEDEYKKLDEKFEMTPTRATFLAWSMEQQERWVESQKELSEVLEKEVKTKRRSFETLNTLLVPLIIIVLGLLRLMLRVNKTHRTYQPATVSPTEPAPTVTPTESTTEKQ
jgi:ABC-type uncharacterized transport system involved in gliding motility auxiliary subunit